MIGAWQAGQFFSALGVYTLCQDYFQVRRYRNTYKKDEFPGIMSKREFRIGNKQESGSRTDQIKSIHCFASRVWTLIP